jgi:FKBP-type peptidyl-prolyl cis-trans isomerase
MKEGSIARLVLTSDNAFKKSTNAPVPPDTPVVFDIELLRIY